ncbi:MAG: molecular chaperone GroEL [Candidatus Paceibacterota bacterium]
MSKKILFGEKAKHELKIGVDAIGDAVKITLGPRGRNVVFDRGYGGPTITNDGVSIANEIVLPDSMQNIGCMVTKGVAQKTNEAAGDGTTTSIVLMQSIVEEGMKAIKGNFWQFIKRLFSFKSLRVNAIGVKNGLEKASKIAIKALKSNSVIISSKDWMKRVAVISSESEEIGIVISDTIEKLGEDAVITVEESPVVGITSHVSQGLEFDKGFVSPYMVIDKDRGEAECKDVKILVTDMKIGIVEDILPLLEETMKSGRRELVIIAEDIIGEALQTFVVNKIRGGLTVIGIKAPGFGTRKRDYLEDIATVVGAKFVSNDLGIPLSNITLEDLGSADRVVATKDKTTIIGGHGKKEDIESRIATAKKELEGLESKHDQLKVQERIGKLSGGVAIIKVGAASETETRYLKLKVEDAVNAVKAAIEEGIVIGGGCSLIRASESVLRGITGTLTADEKIGFKILAKSLCAPLKNIAINAGQGDGRKIVKNVKKMYSNGGYDALAGEYVKNMFDAGIVDPLKVERCAIENAVSAGGTLLTMEVSMAELPKDKPDMM